MTHNQGMQQLIDLFRSAGEAHHRAFVETGGDDLEWPVWYANYLREPLGALLDQEFTQSELATRLAQVEQAREEMATAADWPTFYARFFLGS
jgi:hypothetical protein